MGFTLVDELRADEQAVRAVEEKVWPVPPRGVVVVRFRPPRNPDALVPVIAAYKANGALPVDVAEQLIIDCTDEILRTANGESYEDGADLIQPEDGPLTFDASDERWGSNVKTARECVGVLYNVANQPGVLAGICDMLIDWLQGVDAAVLARVEGKSGSVAETSSTQPDCISMDSTDSATSESNPPTGSTA